MSDLDKRLGEASKTRERLASTAQRLSGRLDAAKVTLGEIEEECRGRGVDPEKLDETIEKLEGRYRGLVEALEADLEAAQEALNPYL